MVQSPETSQSRSRIIVTNKVALSFQRLRRIAVGHVSNVPNQRNFEHVENVLHEIFTAATRLAGSAIVINALNHPTLGTCKVSAPSFVAHVAAMLRIVVAT